MLTQELQNVCHMKLNYAKKYKYVFKTYYLPILCYFSFIVIFFIKLTFLLRNIVTNHLVIKTRRYNLKYYVILSI